MSEADTKGHYTLYADAELVEHLDMVSGALRIPRSTLMRAMLRPTIERYLDMTPAQIRADLWPTPRVAARRRGRGSHPLPILCGWCSVPFSPLRCSTLYCTRMCMQLAGLERRSLPPDELGVRRRREHAKARDSRRARREIEPAFREAEAKWAREYRARKKAAGG